MRERMWTGTENGGWKHVRKMKSTKYRFSFDKNSSNLAALSPDGRLKVWETTNGNLCHDWSPPVGLQATCTCLCWVNSDVEGKPSRPKKAKKNSASNDDAKYHIVLGTLQGSLILLNYGLLEVENKLEKEHKGKINDICFNEATGTLYSGSNDKYIFEWSYPSMQTKSKWKADKHGVHKLEVSPDGSCILSAGRTIKLWSIETKQLLQKFTGHTSLITKLLFAPMANGKPFCEECYFLSASDDDQMINAWHHDPTSEDTNAVCCFISGSNPASVDISLKDAQQLKLAVACLDGKVNIFTHVLNGRLTKPIDSSLSFQLVKSDNKKNAANFISLHAVRLVDNDTVLLVYGSPISPTFEKLDLSSLVNGAKIKRDTSRSLLQGGEEQSSSKKRGKADKSVVIDPNVPLQVQQERHLATAEGNSTVDKERDELTLGDRLTTTAAPKKDPTKKVSTRNREKPNALSMTQMLVQGLHSDDDKLIDSVLYNAKKEAIIIGTVKRLPTSSTVKLINKIVLRIQRNPSRGYELTFWLRSLMSLHMTYLLSIPNLMNSLSGLYQSLDTRTKVYPKLSKLHGRLDLLLTHVASRQNTTVQIADINESALVIDDKEESEDEDDKEKCPKENDDYVEDEDSNDDDDDESDGDGDGGEDDDDDDYDDEMEESEVELLDSVEQDQEQVTEHESDVADIESEIY